MRRRQGFTRHGFRGAGDAARDLIRPAFSKRGFAEHRLITEWDAIMGEAVAALCRPLRLSFASSKGFGATLTLGTLGSRAPEVQHLAPMIVERVNAHYGFRAVSRITLRQVGPEALAERGAGRAPPQPCPEVLARMRPTLDGVGDGDLREALETLARNVASRRDARGSLKQERTER